MPGARELSGNRMMLDPDVSLCLAMYYQPELSVEVLLAVDGVENYSATHNGEQVILHIDTDISHII